MSLIERFLRLAAWSLVACLAAKACPVPSASGQELDSPEHAFVELSVARSTLFVGEPVTVSVRIGFDTEFFDGHAIQLFQTRLDAPLQLQVRWWDGFSGGIVMDEDPEIREDGPLFKTLALNQDIVKAKCIGDRTIRGRRFTVLEVKRTFLIEKMGELHLSEPVLRYAYASAFQDTLLSGRVALDREDAAVPGEPLSLTVTALPEKGRPESFYGAVGRIEVEADVYPKTVVFGESLRLTLTLHGRGNLPLLDPPAIEEQLHGFQVYGRIEGESGPGYRTFRYDLLPVDPDLSELPAIAFSFFETGPGAAYRTIRTSPIPIRIESREDPGEEMAVLRHEDRTAMPGLNDIYDLKPVNRVLEDGPETEVSWFSLVVVFLFPWPVAVGLLFWQRARERIRRDPLGSRARKAHEVFRAAIDAPDSDPLQIFIEYLAARMHCAQGAVVSPDLAQRLLRLHVTESDAREAADLLDTLISSRYARLPAESGQEAIRGLVERLEARFKIEEEEA